MEFRRHPSVWLASWIPLKHLDMLNSRSDITRILLKIESGDQQASEELLPVVYDELRNLGAAKLAKEEPGQTLSATSLVHEAYIRLVDTDKAQQWNSRGHFFAAAAEAMRRILVEKARRERRSKHGGDVHRVDLEAVEITTQGPGTDILALDEALTKLTDAKPEIAELVKLRYFAGLTVREAARALDISTSTADRHWAYARAWLYRELVPEGEL